MTDIEAAAATTAATVTATGIFTVCTATNDLTAGEGAITHAVVAGTFSALEHDEKSGRAKVSACGKDTEGTQTFPTGRERGITGGSTVGAKDIIGVGA